MASSLVEKYEIILAADPRSRVFVELARALVERGDLARAVDVCRQGLEHHPGSIQGRLVWARALLLGGDADSAVGQLEAAIAVEPQVPYAYNLAAELLVEAGMAPRALPILERAAAMQPANEKIRQWLALARGGAEAKPAPIEQQPAPPTEPIREQTLELELPAGGGAGEATSAAATAAPTSTPSATQTTTPNAAQAPPPAAGGSASRPSPLRSGAAPPPPFKREVTNPRFALSMLPEAAPRPPAPAAAPAPAPDASEAARIATQYEHELRTKLLDVPEPPPSFWRQHWVAVLSLGLAVLVLGGGGTTYLLVRRQNRSQEVRSDVESAKKGLARDTVGALREAARVLAEARELDPSHREAISLSTEVAALLGSDYGDEAARDLARRLVDSGNAGEGAHAAHHLLASTPAEREAAADPLATAPIRVGPLIQVLAGEVLLARGEVESGVKRLVLAAGASPPMLRALADLGDFYRSRGDLEQALVYYQAALSAHATHPRSTIGAAEVRLALGRDLDVALRNLQAVEADAGSAPPTAERVRFELAFARLLAAAGNRGAAAERLDRAAEKLGAKVEGAAAAAEIYLASGALDRAEQEAERAVKLAPQEIGYRTLLARALAGRGRYRELLGATQGQDAREIRLWRGIARYELGEYAKGLGELELTRRDGKMPAEAAAYYALAEFALGREARARALLTTLTALKTPPAVAFVASGHIEQARGRADRAESDFRAAVTRDPASLEGNCALGRLLLSQGRSADALPFLEKAALVNPFHAEARIALARARLAGGNARAAREELAVVLASEPRNADALRTSSAAALADRDPAGARHAADRAVAADPRNAESWLAAARAALAQGDAAAARRHAQKAAKIARGSAAAEARRILAEAKRKR